MHGLFASSMSHFQCLTPATTAWNAEGEAQGALPLQRGWLRASDGYLRCCGANHSGDGGGQICEAFGANRYPFPEEAVRQRQMNAEVTARLRELQTTIEAGTPTPWPCAPSPDLCPPACILGGLSQDLLTVVMQDRFLFCFHRPRPPLVASLCQTDPSQGPGTAFPKWVTPPPPPGANGRHGYLQVGKRDVLIRVAIAISCGISRATMSA